MSPTASSTGRARPREPNWPMWMLGLVTFIDQADQSIVKGVVTPLQNDPSMHLTDLQVGVLLSSFVIVTGLLTVPAGYLIDRWHRTRTIGNTLIGWSGLSALTAAMPNFAGLLAVRSALGFGSAIDEPGAASLLGDFYSQERRGEAFSVQQILFFLGFALGLGAGGAIGAVWGWRWAFVVVAAPGFLVAYLAHRLREPSRGEADRATVGAEEPAGQGATADPLGRGLWSFVREMYTGLRADARTVLSITTMRYALVGVSALLFTITAVGAALPQFYEKQLGVPTGRAEVFVGLMVLLGGIPGVLLGGRVADRYMTRIEGARMAIPAVCIFVGVAFFTVSYLWVPFVVAFPVEVIGFLIVCMAIPALRAGLTDAVPANLRGAGFGFFNLASVVLGTGFASFVVFALAGAFSNDYRVAFLILSPPVFFGALLLWRARKHMDADAAKIFEAIVRAMQDQQAAQDGFSDVDRTGAASANRPAASRRRPSPPREPRARQR